MVVRHVLWAGRSRMSTTFWATHQVGGPYYTLEASERALRERRMLYPSLEDLMPTDFPGKTVLDFGCGPGHDTILFLENGAGHVFYSDISPLALEIMERRLELHGFENRSSPVPLGETLSLKVDHVHCAGVLHHTDDPMSILKDLRSIISPDGDARFMVYDGDLSEHTQSKVPITHWWTPLEFAVMCEVSGWTGEYVGSYACSTSWRPNCFASCYRCVPA